MLNYNLKTPYQANFDMNNPLPEYPRPEFVRKSFLNLNGMWDYCVTKTFAYPESWEGKICVPYVIESQLSQVRRDLNSDDILWYQRSFTITKDYLKDKTILHFGAVMQKCDVFINGIHIDHHNGGYLDFSYDIRNYIHEGENTIGLSCVNWPDKNYSVGKQANKRGGIWYTKNTGIWKTVWIESYDNEAISKVTVDSNIDGTVKIKIDSPNDSFRVVILMKNKVIREIITMDKEIVTSVPDPLLWSPDSPFLYTVKVSNFFDEVSTYFAFREFKIQDGYFYLNNQKIFVNGLLDQGYYSDGLFTPASYEAFKDDIIKMKNLGYNALRKHVKVESSYYYYLADKCGMLILQDFPNSGKYHFFHDSVLPVIGIKYWLNAFEARNNLRRKNFIEQGMGIIEMLKMHPSVVYYTIFNEGWGQFDPDRLYQLFKKEDPSRIFDSTSGWFYHRLSDVYSAHYYFKRIKVTKKKKRAFILSEFGGYVLKVQNHIFNSEKEFGYKYFYDNREYTKALCDTYENEIIANIPRGLAGCIYTQISDIEDETNGIMTYDRQKIKVDEKMLKEVLKKATF